MAQIRSCPRWRMLQNNPFHHTSYFKGSQKKLLIQRWSISFLFEVKIIRILFFLTIRSIVIAWMHVSTPGTQLFFLTIMMLIFLKQNKVHVVMLIIMIGHSHQSLLSNYVESTTRTMFLHCSLSWAEFSVDSLSQP